VCSARELQSAYRGDSNRSPCLETEAEDLSQAEAAPNGRGTAPQRSHALRPDSGLRGKAVRRILGWPHEQSIGGGTEAEAEPARLLAPAAPGRQDWSVSLARPCPTTYLRSFLIDGKSGRTRCLSRTR
jgi:hypothetical protein